MSSSFFDRRRESQQIKAKIVRQLAQQHQRDLNDMAEAIRHGSKPEPLPDVPLHKRGFGVMDEDLP